MEGLRSVNLEEEYFGDGELHLPFFAAWSDSKDSITFKTTLRPTWENKTEVSGESFHGNGSNFENAAYFIKGKS